MKLVLNIYTDESLTEVKRVVEADRLKIPYRVVTYIAQSLETVDLDNQNDLLNFVVFNVDKLDKVIKATFGVTEAEMDCIDLAELGSVAREIYEWGVEKFKGLGGNSKNAQATA